MIPNTSLLSQVGRWLVPAILMVGTQVRGAAINTGVEEILWPAVIVAAPFVVVHELLFGSDDSARRSADKDAARILDAQQEPIPINGLYAGSVNLRWALYGMFVESRLPFIEVDTAGSVWLLSLAKDPQPLISEAVKHRYLRLSFGQQGDPRCVDWKGFDDDWAAYPPVRPGACVIAVFDDELRSDIQLDVDASRVSHRRLQWVLTDRSTGKVRLAIPFWQSQTKGKPLWVPAVYRAGDENGSFIRLLRKLSPAVVLSNPAGLPFVMNRVAETRPARGFNAAIALVQGEFRPPVLDWRGMDAPRTNETWREAYDRAVATRKPVITGKLLILPGQDRLDRACAFADLGSCEFAHSFVSDAGLLTLQGHAAYAAPKPSGAEMWPARSSEMSVSLAARRFSGEFLWRALITPTSLPQAYERCKDFSLKCSFYPTQATTTAEDLIIRGVLMVGSDASPRDEYELVVPLARLSPVDGAH